LATSKSTIYPPVRWRGDRVSLIDQTLLPEREVVLDIVDYRDLAAAIRSLKVRGAPAIGIAAAYGLALAAVTSRATSAGTLLAELREARDALAATRPTAVNLFWALDRVMAAAVLAHDCASMRDNVLKEARSIHEESLADELRIGALGASLLSERGAVLTHCNAGALATGGYGTALGVIRAAFESGKVSEVYADETRPLLQGARLTAWELARDGIPVTVIADGAAAALMAQGRIACVIVGADRIARNGDTANKVGTYGLAIAARAHDIPFYVAAPTSTIDLSLASGALIPIEERSADELRRLGDTRIVADGAQVLNPAFDVTPGRYISAIITEKDVAMPPYEQGLVRICGRRET
jgi:methylthioribose-1-phosphate isomerase